MPVCISLQTDNHASTSHSVFYRPDALHTTQPTASKHWRHKKQLQKIFMSLKQSDQSPHHLAGLCTPCLESAWILKISVLKSRMADGCHLENRRITISWWCRSVERIGYLSSWIFKLTIFNRQCTWTIHLASVCQISSKCHTVEEISRFFCELFFSDEM